jgi:hypothetical protein
MLILRLLSCFVTFILKFKQLLVFYPVIEVHVSETCMCLRSKFN